MGAWAEGLILGFECYLPFLSPLSDWPEDGETKEVVEG